MSEEIDWFEEIAGYDANAAIQESRIMWLKMGRHFKSVAESFADFFERPELDGNDAIEWAARAEACMWRATGDADAIDTARFLRSKQSEQPA